MTQDDFDTYYLKHFELISKQVMEKKVMQEKSRSETGDEDKCDGGVPEKTATAKSSEKGTF